MPGLRQVDYRCSIIFSLGVSVCEMATGQHPFLGESHATISHRILFRMPIHASSRHPP
jgi:hypothetical protein